MQSLEKQDEGKNPPNSILDPKKTSPHAVLFITTFLCPFELNIMTAIIVELSEIRKLRAEKTENELENKLRREVSSFNESLQETMDRFQLNMPMIATLLMAKAVEALEDCHPLNRTEAEEFSSASQLVQSIVSARARAHARATADAMRFSTMPTGA